MRLMKAAGFIAGADKNRQPTAGARRPGPRVSAEERRARAVAALFFIFGAIVITDSVRLGFGWQEVARAAAGLLPVLHRPDHLHRVAGQLSRASPCARGERNKTFVEVGQLKIVLTVLIPTAIYAALVTWIGIYASSVLFIGFFMRWLGKYRWWKVIAGERDHRGGVLRVFEIWFKVPLPKGPVESVAAALGLH